MCEERESVCVRREREILCPFVRKERERNRECMSEDRKRERESFCFFMRREREIGQEYERVGVGVDTLLENPW